MKLRPGWKELKWCGAPRKRTNHTKLSLWTGRCRVSMASKRANGFARCPNLHGSPQLVMVTAYGREEVLKQAEENCVRQYFDQTGDARRCCSIRRSRFSAQRVRRLTKLAAAPAVELGRIRGARVLLVEDNELNREVALGLLEDAHLSIDMAENGQSRRADGRPNTITIWC